MTDIRDIEPESIIDSKNITVVAMKGSGNDWAVYFVDTTGQNVAAWLPDYLFRVYANGQKLPENAAKQIFPNIGGGPYRGL